MSERLVLPSWAETVRRKYLSGEASVFVLHHNVFDQVLFGGKYYRLTEFLAQVLLRGNKETIAVYDPASGIEYAKRATALKGFEESRLRRDPKDVLPALETLLLSTESTAVIVTYAGALLPAGDFNLLMEDDRINIVSVHRWSLERELTRRDNVVFLITEALSDLHPHLVSNPLIAAVAIPLPDRAGRRDAIVLADPSIDATHVEQLASQTAGLRAVQITTLLAPGKDDALDDAERRSFILKLLGDGPDASKRADKLGALTRGMDEREIRHLINPTMPAEPRKDRDAYAEVLELVNHRKREIIEKECAGLIEFIDPKHDLSVVGGNDAIKDELRQIASAIRAGERSRVPMGLLFVGPMGSGKTFVGNAFIKESGLSAVRLKNFRSKWVGSTESNLEKVLGMVRALGPIVLVIDEGDRAFGDDGDSDGGTSSRVIARIKEFMSDPENRGNVLFILMTNRPDKLDLDIKRAGRLDRKIPFFYPETPEAVEAILDALFRRYEIAVDFKWAAVRGDTSRKLLGYSNADLEAVALLGNDLASRDATKVTAEVLGRAIVDYLPARDRDMLEYMELLAAFEASRRSMLPERYRNLSTDELNQRLREQRRLIGR